MASHSCRQVPCSECLMPVGECCEHCPGFPDRAELDNTAMNVTKVYVVKCASTIKCGADIRLDDLNTKSIETMDMETFRVTYICPNCKAVQVKNISKEVAAEISKRGFIIHHIELLN